MLKQTEKRRYGLYILEKKGVLPIAVDEDKKELFVGKTFGELFLDLVLTLSVFASSIRLA